MSMIMGNKECFDGYILQYFIICDSYNKYVIWFMIYRDLEIFKVLLIQLVKIKKC